MIEKILFKKWQIETWLIFLLLIVFSAVTLTFGSLVYSHMENNRGIGPLGAKAVNIARIPSLVERVLSGGADRHRRMHDRFDQPAGFNFYKEVASPNYVLLHRYDGDARESIVELIFEGETEPLHVWHFDDLDQLRFEVKNAALHDPVTADASKRRGKFILVEENGEAAFHFRQSPMYKYDVCQRVVWMNNDFAYHHSLEKDADGNYWVPGSTFDVSRLGYAGRGFADDHIVQISPDGETLYAKSIIDILNENGLRNRMYPSDSYHRDPIHLNDIEPMLEDGPHWRKDDLFLSLPHINMMMLFRPSTDELIWFTQDVMQHQHDVDVLDENRIVYFNNNRAAGIDGNFIMGSNELAVYDFRDGSTTSPWRDIFVEADIRTISQGLQHITPEGAIMAEETAEGRVVKFAPNGEMEWEYINKNSNGDVFTMNWSRYLDRDYGDRVLESLQAADCP